MIEVLQKHNSKGQIVLDADLNDRESLSGSDKVAPPANQARILQS